MNLDTKPPKGTSDWDVSEYKIRNNIFKKWRSVVKKFGYQEYLTPIIEASEIYKAKSGEDVGGKELMEFKDKAGRELVIRPEMTPSVTRLVAKNYESLAKPIRLFSIANFVRNENPQRGRNREFWQLNLDIFGSNSIYTEIEVLVISIELMLAFNPPKDSFVLRLNHRNLINDFLNQIIGINNIETKQHVVRILDKYKKLTEEELNKRLSELGLNKDQISDLVKFMSINSLVDFKKSFPQLIETEGLTELEKISNKLEELGYQEFISYSPDIIRGFDYYDGVVFEIFDKHPDNTRALFGGGRYNGLGSIFGVEDLPAIGFAPGDETFKLFLESWDMLDELLDSEDIQIYFPLLSNDNYTNQQDIAKIIRSNSNKKIFLTCGIEEERLGKAIKSAANQDFDYVIICGDNEISEDILIIKNLQSGDQHKIDRNKDSIHEYLSRLKK